MAIPWNATVTASKTLHVYPAPSITKGTWKHVFAKAIVEFNALAKKNGVGVKLDISTTAPSMPGGAEVSVESAAGPLSGSYGGSSWGPIAFSGTSIEGYTVQPRVSGKLDNVFVFLPATPTIKPFKGAPRPVGEAVNMLILLHELVHACGLQNTDHATDDMFQGYPDVDVGATPSSDTIRIPGGKMPPFVLGGATVKKLKSLWP